MSGSLTIWIVLAVVSVFLELLTRTFTMLALGIGFGLAALLAWMGFSFVVELIAAVVVGLGCVVWLRKSPTGQALQEAEDSRHSAMSDDGDEVHISQWDAGDQVDVVYRGRTWEAKLAQGATRQRGLYKVREVREGKLILEEKDK